MILSLIKWLDNLIDDLAYPLAYVYWPIGWVIEKVRDR
jgi:hypothetical protein